MTPTTTETTGTWLRLTATHVSDITSKILYMDFYQVELSCENPSADGTWYFSTRESAEEAKATLELRVIKSPGYYGDAKIYITDLPLGL